MKLKPQILNIINIKNKKDFKSFEDIETVLLNEYIWVLQDSFYSLEDKSTLKEVEDIVNNFEKIAYEKTSNDEFISKMTHIKKELILNIEKIIEAMNNISNEKIKELYLKSFEEMINEL